MIDCKRCKKKFTQTSWTRDRFWILVCPACVVILLNKVRQMDPEESEKLGKG